MIDDATLLDVGAAAATRRLSLAFDPSDMISLIASGQSGLQQLQRLAVAEQYGSPEVQEIRIHAPIPRPRKNVFCVGWNYLEHFEEGARLRASGQELPKHPVFFTKANTAVNQPFGDILCDTTISEKYDWEVELGVVIGTGGRSISEEALNIFGYTVVTTSPCAMWRLTAASGSKARASTHLPARAYLITADHRSDQSASQLQSQRRRKLQYQTMYFKILQLIAELSLGIVDRAILFPV